MSRTAVILSGGLGTRLRPFTNAIPKPLLPVGEKAVLEIQIERLVQFGFDEVVLATNYKTEYIERFFGDGSRYGVKLTISKEDEPLGTAGPLKLLEGRLSSPFLVMNGDILSLVDYDRMFDFARRAGAALTVGIKKIVLPYAFGNIYYEGDFVTGLQEKPDLVTYALAGIYVMTPAALDRIPKATYYGMDKLIQAMLADRAPVAKYEIEEYWLDIGQIGDYEKAQKDFGEAAT